MKNYLKLTLISLVSILVLASCGKDGDATSSGVFTGEFDLTYTAGGDLLKVAEVSIEYIDADGTPKSEKVTTAVWKKNVKYTKLPAKSGYKVTCVARKPLPTVNTNLSFETSGAIKLLKDGIMSSIIKDLEDGYALAGILPNKVEEKLAKMSYDVTAEITTAGATAK